MSLSGFRGRLSGGPLYYKMAEGLPVGAGATATQEGVQHAATQSVSAVNKMLAEIQVQLTERDTTLVSRVANRFSLGLRPRIRQS